MTADIDEPLGLILGQLGEVERRSIGIFEVSGGVLAGVGHSVSTVQNGRASVTLMSAVLKPGAAQFGQTRVLAADLAAPMPLSAELAPVLLNAEAGDFVWALEAGGVVRAGPAGAAFLGGLPEGRITAMAVAAGWVVVAVQDRQDAAQVYRASLSAIPTVWHALAGTWARSQDAATPAHVNALAVFDGHVYAGASDARLGFSLWRCALEGADWQAVVTRGAWRHGYNRAISTMAVVDGRLFVAVDGPDLAQVYLGDEHPEIFAVDRDGSWQLISGQARFTPNGLVQPSTQSGPGTPECSGLTIAALHGRGAGAQMELNLWLVPRTDSQPAQAGLVTRWHWSQATQVWSVPQALSLPAMAVSGLARLDDGRVLAAARTNSAAQTGPRDLVIALTPR